jgi:hypothetical protein
MFCGCVTITAEVPSNVEVMIAGRKSRTATHITCEPCPVTMFDYAFHRNQYAEHERVSHHGLGH